MGSLPLPSLSHVHMKSAHDHIKKQKLTAENSTTFQCEKMMRQGTLVRKGALGGGRCSLGSSYDAICPIRNENMSANEQICDIQH